MGCESATYALVGAEVSDGGVTIFATRREVGCGASRLGHPRSQELHVIARVAKFVGLAAIHDGEADAPKLDYGPLPKNIVLWLDKRLAAVKNIAAK